MKDIDNPTAFIHPSAEVSTDSRLGKNVKIWNCSKIREQVRIGELTNIGQCVYIDKNVVIGRCCKIQNGVQVYDGVIIEDDVFVGPNVTFSNDKYPRAFNIEWEITKTIVKKGASIGAGATIVCGVTIGEYAMVAAGSVVTKNVSSYTLVAGNPAKDIHSIDLYGKKIEHE